MLHRSGLFFHVFLFLDDVFLKCDDFFQGFLSVGFLVFVIFSFLGLKPFSASVHDRFLLWYISIPPLCMLLARGLSV